MRKNKGITLIALIITIIILIILTAVTINNVIGTDLIGFATKAVENYTDAARDEAEKTDKLATALDNQGVGEDSAVRAGQIVTSKTKTETENKGEEEGKITYNYTDAAGKHAMVPEGFKVSTKSSEQYIDDGLVIQDSDGNEFVWIPCTTTQYTEAKDDVIDKNWSQNAQYKANGGTDGKDWRDDYTDDDKKKLDSVYSNSLPTGTWSTKQIEDGKTSIGKYGGFYIARYEAGIPEDASFYFKNKEIKDGNNYVDTQNQAFTVQWTNNTTTHGRGSVADTDSIKDYKPVSKQGVQAWNYITQPNAKMVAENMYKGSNSVGSYLVDSQAWNHICSNIFNVGTGTSINSTDYGNYFNNRTFTPKHGTLWARHINDNNSWTIAKLYTTDTVKYSEQDRK